MRQFLKSIPILLLISSCMFLTACSVATSEHIETEMPSASSSSVLTVDNSALSQSELQSILSEISNFTYSYIECKEIVKNKYYSETDYITTEHTADNGELHYTKWYKICSGEITRYSEFESALNRLFSTQMINSIRDRINSCYLNSDNNIYISEYAGYDGGVMGLDTVEILSYEEEESTIIVHLKAIGDKDYWELTQDNIVFFDMVLSQDGGEWKLHQCELTELLYLAWLYN